MARIGTTPCPQIMSTEMVNNAVVTVPCGIIADVEYIDGVPFSTCSEGHTHSLSESYVTEFVTLD